MQSTLDFQRGPPSNPIVRQRWIIDREVKTATVHGTGRSRSFDDDVVVDLGMDAFWTNGYANTSPAQLAAATGVAKGQSVQRVQEQARAVDRALARYDLLGSEFAKDFLSRPGSTRECIGSFLRILVDSDVAQPLRRGCLAVNTAVELAGHDPEILRAIRTMQEHSIAALAARIDQGRRDGDVSPDIHGQTFAEFLMTTIVGLRVMAKTYDAPMVYGRSSSCLPGSTSLRAKTSIVAPSGALWSSGTVTTCSRAT